MQIRRSCGSSHIKSRIFMEVIHGMRLFSFHDGSGCSFLEARSGRRTRGQIRGGAWSGSELGQGLDRVLFDDHLIMLLKVSLRGMVMADLSAVFGQDVAAAAEL